MNVDRPRSSTTEIHHVDRASKFLEYFLKNQKPLLSLWAFAFRARALKCTVAELRLLKATTSNAIEAYHGVLKGDLGIKAGRVDKLISDLTGLVYRRYLNKQIESIQNERIAGAHT